MQSSLGRALLLLLLTVAGALVAACEDDSTATVIIGVTSDYAAGSDLARLDVVMSADGAVIFEDSLALGASAGRTNFPTELSFEDVRDGAALVATLTGYDGDEVERVVRTVSTTAKLGPPRLLRVHLEALCKLEPDAGAGPSAPTCDEVNETCITGQCRPAFVDPSQHEPYTEDWAGNAGDACKPAASGEPIVVLGKGMSDYFAAEDYELAEVEAGPQGGHHIWIAARIKNLRRSGSITSVGGEFPELGISVTPLKVIFTMDPDEGGYCKLYGLRFQIDIDGHEVETLLGQDVKVIMTVTDPDGDVGTDELWVSLSDYVI